MRLTDRHPDLEELSPSYLEMMRSHHERLGEIPPERVSSGGGRKL